jgi:hypothetical protein
MAKNISTTRYNNIARCLAALALVFVYFVSTSAILVGASTSSAQARGFGRGGGRGWGRGGGWGRGVYIRGGGCFWSNRWGRYICPY